jgi:hypothetical protein
MQSIIEMIELVVIINDTGMSKRPGDVGLGFEASLIISVSSIIYVR